jgi:myosin-crossreactive antigen
MSDCTGKDILQELCGHLNFDLDTVELANCIPCRMPYITSMFMPRAYTDRPLPVPKNSQNLAATEIPSNQATDNSTEAKRFTTIGNYPINFEYH